MARRPSYASVVSGPPDDRLEYLLYSNHMPFDYDEFAASSTADNDTRFSRMLGSFTNGSGYGNGNGNTTDARTDKFFIPSYLQGSPHVERLAEAHRAKQAAQRDATNSTQTPQSSSLSTSSSSINIKPPSHRGMTYDLIEKAPPLEDDGLPPLPSRWSTIDKHAGLEVMGDGLEVKLTGPKPISERDHEACTIRADHYIPSNVGLYYFEVTIMSRPKQESSIGIGFSAKNVSLSRVPGWEPDSWAYHGDDGNAFCSQQTGKPYGPKFSGGDVIGCGINFRTGQAFFTKNGNHLGVAFRDFKGKLFPSVGMKKAGEQVRVNFGQSPFIFDIDTLMEDEQRKLRKEIEATKTDGLAPNLTETQLIQKMVLQYLQHEGYTDAAQAFASEVNENERALNIDSSQAPVIHNVQEDKDAVSRQSIRTAIVEGEIDKALQDINTHYPNVFENSGDIYFRLRCQKFIEMIRQAADNISQQSSNGHSSNGGYDEGLTSAMELDDQPAPETYSTDNDHSPHNNGESDEAPKTELDQKQKLMDAIKYGQELKAEFKDDQTREVTKALEDAYALIAYQNPYISEFRHLLDKERREDVAEELNKAILVSLGKSSTTALELAYQQTAVLLEGLSENGGPGSFINLDDAVYGRGPMWGHGMRSDSHR